MKTSLTILFCFFVLSSYSQKKPVIVKGKIKDQNNISLANAIIIIKDTLDNVLEFKKTNTNGEFSFDLNYCENQLKLTIKKHGFNEESIVIGCEDQDFNIELESTNTSEIRLEDLVVVGEKPPISSKGDTTIYEISKFSDGTEKYVEELIKKLPGLQVDESSGEIKYQGKEIKGIYLDGDDITGSNYQQISKNLSADWLSGIEVIKNVQDKRLLKGITKSSDIIINLSLNESAKSRIFGKISVGLGVKYKYDFKSELLTYLKNLKSLTTLNSNNISQDFQTFELDFYKDFEFIDEEISISNSIFQNEILYPDFVNEDFFNNHLGFNLSNSFLAKYKDKSRLRVSTNFYANKLKFNFSDKESYLNEDNSIFSINEVQDQLQKPLDFYQNIKFDKYISPRTDLLLNLKYRISENKLTDGIVNQSNNIAQTNIENHKMLIANFNLITKINEKMALETLFYFGGDKERESQDFKIVNPENDPNFILTKIYQDYTNFRFYSRLNGIIGKNFFYTSSLGWLNRKSNFYYSNTENSLSLNKYFFELNFTKNFWKFFFIKFNNNLNRNTVKYNSQVEERFFYEPVFLLSIKNTKENKIELNSKALYSVNYEYLNIDELFSEPVFTDYFQKIYFNTDFKKAQRSELLLFSLNANENNKSYINSEFSFGIENKNNTIIQQNQVENDILIRKYIQSGISKNYFGKFSVSKYFVKLKSNIQFSYEQNQLNYPIYNKNENNLIGSISSINYGVFAGINASKNLNISTSLSFSKNSSNVESEKSIFQFSKYYLKAVWKLNEQIKMNFSNQFLLIKDLELKQNLFSNFDFYYTPKSEEWEVSFSVFNIVNNRQLNLISYEPVSVSEFKFNLLPRYFLLTYEFKF